MGLDVRVIKTFYDWCIENNRMDLNDRFDEDKNGCTTKDVGYKSNLKYWFKCPQGLHESEAVVMSSVTRDQNKRLLCNKCNSVAQFVIDKFGEDYLWSHWRDDNELSPWDIPHGSKAIVVKLQCIEKSYHKYEQVAGKFSIGRGCPYCASKIIHPNDSLAAMYPEVINRWSDKNTKSPWEYSPHTDKKVWFKCPEGIHEDYLQRVHNAVTYGFTCRKCETARWGVEHRGEKSSSWRGGICEDNKIQRNRLEYIKWRTNVYERDNYTCQCCGSRNCSLNAHHINSFAKYPELRFVVDNGLTLCTKCHDSTESGSLHHIYGTYDIIPDILRQYILDKSNKDIYITNPNLLYQTPLLPSDEFDFN